DVADRSEVEQIRIAVARALEERLGFDQLRLMGVELVAMGLQLLNRDAQQVVVGGDIAQATQLRSQLLDQHPVDGVIRHRPLPWGPAAGCRWPPPRQAARS